mmetsp:Transcript_5656/g.6941  ORF Transcript_5656/g.6941 Transcript_5656/m.6941 type:complete len:529 (+) Transcript_5656:64-1650(+)|eukprot:CAMPEP_0203655132 /NCGR_PEP_ID=MMETSP0088-20131115/37285_1 /ASSEMBLY_ACC=CAM_ASM_001087 /TAXON_ID=426623 /ORGANISM="Chaetoceros affinis, Strain CCMP159" /LENGTH=528 /DNA_ID=CAMNT_0050515637 /DNA_START=17 /DNA_END=1603 /DNA_ORIENTATION=+
MTLLTFNEEETTELLTQGQDAESPDNNNNYDDEIVAGQTNLAQTPTSAVSSPNTTTHSGRKVNVTFQDAGIGFRKDLLREKRRERDHRLKLEKFRSYQSERTISSFPADGSPYGSIRNNSSYSEIDTVTNPYPDASTPLKDEPTHKKGIEERTLNENEIKKIKCINLETKDILISMIFESSINILLLFMPFALASHYLDWSPVAIFIFNFLTMIPLAALLGDFTEEVAAHTNQTIGGLINASFGNAVEVVVAIEALLAGEYRVVQASMIGSIFSNLLLVLGCCFLFGGFYHKEQEYSLLVSTANMGLLGLSCIALILPTPFAQYYDVNEEEALMISRIVALCLIFMYAQLLYFQLKTHADFMGQEDDEKATLPFGIAMFALVVITTVIAFLSNFLVGSIDGFCEDSGISKTFTGLIILPIVGNAVEHMTAVSVAMKNKMDLAMGVAVGSATQISLFVTPLVVIVGWIANKPMTLNFPPFEVILFIISVIVVSIILSYPKSNWLEGSMLVTTYFLIAVGFWFEKVVDYS